MKKPEPLNFDEVEEVVRWVYFLVGFWAGIVTSLLIYWITLKIWAWPAN